MKILIIGSAPDSIRARHWNMDLFDRVIVINNAWKVTTKWDELISLMIFLKKMSQLFY